MIRRWFEVVTKGGKPCEESELPDRDTGLRWHRRWEKLGFKRETIMFEQIKAESIKGGHVITFACPGPFYIAIFRPSSAVGLEADRVLDAAKEPDGAVKLVPDIAPDRRRMN